MLVVLGDVGGTWIRLRAVPADAVAPTVAVAEAKQATVGAKLSTVLREFMAPLQDVCLVVVGICGAVRGGEAICLSPCAWRVSEGELSAALGGLRVVLINDFEAVGLALPQLQSHYEISTISQGSPPETPSNGQEALDGAERVVKATTARSPTEGTILAVGPGTGLGVALWHNSKVLCSEAGAADFAPRTEQQWTLRHWIAQTHGIDHVELDRVVTGTGIANIFNFLCSTATESCPEAITRQVKESAEPAAVIAALGMKEVAGSDEICCVAMDMFFELLGAELGNLALNFQPSHGVMLVGGGIAAKLADQCCDGRLAAAYRRKGQAAACYKDIPLYICRAPGDEVAILGAWECAKRHLPPSPVVMDVCSGPEVIARHALSILLARLRAKPDLVLCCASGSSPTRLYELLVEEASREPHLVTSLRIVKLDEWVLADYKTHASSCEMYLREQVLDPLGIPPERYLGFDTRGVSDFDLEVEVQRMDAALNAWGGIDISILGLGINGHLGFNEPSNVEPPLHSRVVELSEESQQHPMVAGKVKCKHGITIGLGALLESEVLLVVNGAHKAPALQDALLCQMRPTCPASTLRRSHRAVHCIVDNEAAPWLATGSTCPLSDDVEPAVKRHRS